MRSGQCAIRTKRRLSQSGVDRKRRTTDRKRRIAIDLECDSSDVHELPLPARERSSRSSGAATSADSKDGCGGEEADNGNGADGDTGYGA